MAGFKVDPDVGDSHEFGGDGGWHDYVVPGGKVRLSGTLGTVAANAEIGHWFDPAYVPLQASPVQVGGRQAAWFVQGPWQNGVLRHYRRGGVVARVSREHYFWQGCDRTRSFAEFALLDFMCQCGLPVPMPLGAAWWRSGLSYRAAIVVERIPNVTTLARSLKVADPRSVAAAILQMHDANVWHADLNAFNILLDQQDKVWLIDFDRGRVRQMGARLRDENLARLRRSLRKISDQGEVFAQAVEEAYQHLSNT